MANLNLKTNKEFIDFNVESNVYLNALINGGIEFSQRGTYSATAEAVTSKYHVDRWKEYFGGGSTGCVLTRNTLISSDLPFPSSTYSWKVAANNTTGAGQMWTSQLIEDYGKFKGKIATFSAIIKSNNSNTRLFMYDGVTYTIGSAHSAGSGNWQLLKLTKTISASATLLYCAVGLVDANASNVSITSGDYYEFSAASLNAGATFMPYQPLQSDAELARCQRYYVRLYNVAAYSPFGIMAANAANSGSCHVWLPVMMRSIPAFSSSSAGTFLASYGTNNYILTSIGAGHLGLTVCEVGIGIGSSPWAVGSGMRLHANNQSTGNAYLEYDAELY